MDEADWLASDNPVAMLRHLRVLYEPGVVSEPGYQPKPLVNPRKLRLFACAMWRLALSRAGAAREPAMWEARERLALSIRSAELWADGLPTQPNNGYAVLEEQAEKAANDTVRAPSIYRTVPPSEQAALLREIVGNPFRPVKFSLYEGPVWHASDTLRLDVLALAHAAYDERLPAGTLDPIRLAILADALEEAGCQSEELLRHLRGQEACWHGAERLPGRGRVRYRYTTYGPDSRWEKCCDDGWHTLRGSRVRGCWAMDLILGKE